MKNMTLTQGFVVCVLLVASLTGCARPGFDDLPILSVYIDSSADTLDIDSGTIRSGNFVRLWAGLESAGRAPGPLPDAAVAARFFIGTWTSPLINRGDPPHLGDPPNMVLDRHSYAYDINDPCRVLPHGTDILARYELYDADGNVVKEDSRLLDIICP